MSSLLTDAVRAFVAAPRFAVLGTNPVDGPPQLSVMWYELQGDEIMMNTTVSRAKASNLRRDPRVALCIEDGYSYVTLYGVVRLIEDQATAQADIHRLATLYHNATRADEMMRNQFSKQQRLSLRMSIERVVDHL